MAIAIRNEIADLQVVLERARDALAGIRAQMDATQTRITGYQSALDALDEQEAAHSLQVRTAEQAIEEAESALRQARTAASVAKDTGLEALTGAAVTSAEGKLSTLRDDLSKAQAEQARLTKRLQREREAIRAKIASEAAEHEALEQQARELEATAQETHSRLGQALYEHLIGELVMARETEENLLAALAECRSDRRDLEDGVSARLSDWPDLRKAAQKELDALLPAIEPESVRIARAAKRYLETLAACGQQLEAASPSYPFPMVYQLLAIDAHAVQGAKLAGFPDQAERRIWQIDDYIRAIEQHIKQRQWSVDRY